MPNGGEPPAQDASCPTISGFTFHGMKDSPDNDYNQEELTVEDATKRCFKDADCAAAYVDGSQSYTWLKNKVILPLIDYSDQGKQPGKCRGIYIKLNLHTIVLLPGANQVQWTIRAALRRAITVQGRCSLLDRRQQ